MTQDNMRSVGGCFVKTVWIGMALSIPVLTAGLDFLDTLWKPEVSKPNICVAENGHYSTVSRLIRLVLSLECFIEIAPDFLCPFMND